MSDANVHVGRCFCGAVELTVTGEPTVMGYCHCADCRAWSAGPVNAFTIWPPEAARHEADHKAAKRIITDLTQQRDRLSDQLSAMITQSQRSWWRRLVG